MVERAHGTLERGVDVTMLALEQFAERGEDKYPQISLSWRTNCEYMKTLFPHPRSIRKEIYSTCAIESLNSVIRKGVKRNVSHPNGRRCNKGDPLGKPGRLQKMDDAHQEL